MLVPSEVLMATVTLICAFASGCFLGSYFLSVRREIAYKRAIGDYADKALMGNPCITGSMDSGINGLIIDYMKKTEIRSSKFSFAKRPFRSQEIEDSIRLAGLQGQISTQAFYETRARLILVGGILGGLMGVLFSGELACVLSATGALFGAQLPKHVLKNRIAKRAYETERHLPEMLDVMSLCMRTGLSVDASISIYARHFDTMLANDMENARRQWASGLERRDEALRKIASTYDSVILNRVVDTIIRSIRYGSSMVSNLESDAAEARNSFRSSREERIAKAPVKMMIPTGVLILPAMLIMVLGPVLLELMEGGF